MKSRTDIQQCGEEIVELCRFSKNILDKFGIDPFMDIPNFEYWTNRNREMLFAFCESINLTKKSLSLSFIDISDIEDGKLKAQTFSTAVFQYLEKYGMIENQNLVIFVDYEKILSQN